MLLRASNFIAHFLPVSRLPPSQGYGAYVINNIKPRKFYVTQAMSTKLSKKIAVLFLTVAPPLWVARAPPRAAKMHIQ